MGRALKISLYSAWFSAVFFVCVYFTFPMNTIKRAVIDKAEVALGKDHPVKVGRHGVNPVMTIGDMSTYWLSGVSMQQVRVQLPSSNPDPGTILDVDELNVRVGLLSLLSDAKSLSFSGEFSGGTFSGTADVDDKGTVKALELDVDGVHLDAALNAGAELLDESSGLAGSTPGMYGLGVLLLKVAGAPFGGTVDAEVALELGDDPSKEGKGKIVVRGKKLTVGPGDLKAPGLPMALGIPYIDLGQLDIEIDVAKGKGKAKRFELSGGNITADVDLDLTLSRRVAASRINGGGHVLVDEDFLKNPDNSKLKSALEIASAMPQFTRSQDSDGRIHFELRGTLQAPKPTLSRTAGKKKSSNSRSR